MIACISRRDRRQRLQSVIEHALGDQGTVLIPAFSIGRTQELLYELEDIIHRNQCQTCLTSSAQMLNEQSTHAHSSTWQDIPIILDSPLASRFTQVYGELQSFWDKEAQQRVNKGRHPLAFKQLITVDDHRDHQRMVQHLADSKRPAIVIAGGGMCSGGRIVNYLEAMLDETRHNVLFVGYQAQGTLGHLIQKYGHAAVMSISTTSGLISAQKLARSAVTPRMPTKPACCALLLGCANGQSTCA